MPMTLTGNSKRQREKQNMEDNGFKLINLACCYGKYGFKSAGWYRWQFA